MADSMSPPPPSNKGRRIHRRCRHRGDFGFTDSDMVAARQLMQLSDDSDEDRRKSAAEDGPSGSQVTSARTEAIFGRESGDRGGRESLHRPRKKRYRSIAEIYEDTRPIEWRRTDGHGNVSR